VSSFSTEAWIVESLDDLTWLGRRCASRSFFVGSLAKMLGKRMDLLFSCLFILLDTLPVVLDLE